MRPDLATAPGQSGDACSPTSGCGRPEALLRRSSDRQAQSGSYCGDPRNVGRGRGQEQEHHLGDVLSLPAYPSDVIGRVFGADKSVRNPALLGRALDRERCAPDFEIHVQPQVRSHAESQQCGHRLVARGRQPSAVLALASRSGEGLRDLSALLGMASRLSLHCSRLEPLPVWARFAAVNLAKSGSS